METEVGVILLPAPALQPVLLLKTNKTFLVYPALQAREPHYIPKLDNHIFGLLLLDNWLYV